MKNFVLLLFVVMFTSCTVQEYMTDDLYFSAPRSYNQSNYIDLHDRYLTMKSRNSRWNTFDDDWWYWNSLNSRFSSNWWQPTLDVYPRYIWGTSFTNWNYRNYPFISNYTPVNNWGVINIYQPNYSKPTVSNKHNAPRQFNLQTYGSNNRNFSSERNQTQSMFERTQSTRTINSVNQRVTTNGHVPVRKFE